MSAAALLSELRRRDIQLRADGGELRCSAPAGALTPELRELLRRHKMDLIVLLASAQALARQARAIVPLQRNGAGTPIFGVPGHNGDVFCYRALAQCLGEDHPVYGLQPPGLDGHGEPLARVEELAAHFAAQIRKFQPQGPCIIAGFCAGGAVAWELAQQLVTSGAQVRYLALFGTPFPDYFRRRARPWQRAAQQLMRAAKHARAILSLTWSARPRYIAGELASRRARLDKERAAAQDPVHKLRARVEKATLDAVCAYTPRPFEGRVKLFLAGSGWLRDGVGVERWRALARHAEEYRGPATSTGADMLRDHAGAFAKLMRGD